VKTKETISQNGLPKNFLSRFGEHVTGFLCGLDRVRFPATLRPLFCPNGPDVYLNYCKVLIKNFKGFAQALSDRVKKLRALSGQDEPIFICPVRSLIKKH
jgi:hypothetical protein